MADFPELVVDFRDLTAFVEAVHGLEGSRDEVLSVGGPIMVVSAASRLLHCLTCCAVEKPL